MLFNIMLCYAKLFYNTLCVVMLKLVYIFYTADAQDFPPVFVNPDSDSGDWIDVYENEFSGLNIYNLSVTDLDGNGTHTYRCLFVSYFSQYIHYPFCISYRPY